MKYKAHEYQEYATKFIEENEESAVFLECGLGKSVITLTAIKNLMARGEVSRVLVVAPLRVGKTTWPEEIGKCPLMPAPFSYRTLRRLQSRQ